MNQTRDIFRRSRHVRNEVRELLQSIFVSELICPSQELWIVSPWLSDIEVIDSTGDAFMTVLGDGQSGSISLSGALLTLAEQGTRVRVVTRPDVSAAFCEAMARRLAYMPQRENVTVKTIDTLHTKGLVGDDYRVIGSMNFTFNGVHINDEWIQFDRNREAIARTRLEFEKQYGDSRV